MIRTILRGVVTLFLVTAYVAQGSNLASDDASDSIYSGPPTAWTNGMNGGSGFGPWNLNAVGSAGFFVWSSTENGNGLDDGIFGGVANDSDIDTVSWTNVSWGMYATIGSFASASRMFTGSTSYLEPGQSFSVNFDNGYIDPGGRFSLNLIDASLIPVLSISFFGGGSFYSIQDNNGSFMSPMTFGDEGFNLTVTIGSTATDYTASLTRFDGSNYTWTGTFAAPAEGFSVTLENLGIGGPSYNFYINSMQIVPEPATISLAMLATGVCLWRMRKRRVN